MSEWPKKLHAEGLGPVVDEVVPADLARELYEQLRDGLGPQASAEVGAVLARYEREVGDGEG